MVPHAHLAKTGCGLMPLHGWGRESVGFRRPSRLPITGDIYLRPKCTARTVRTVTLSAIGAEAPKVCASRHKV